MGKEEEKRTREEERWRGITFQSRDSHRSFWITGHGARGEKKRERNQVKKNPPQFFFIFHRDPQSGEYSSVWRSYPKIVGSAALDVRST